ncbi:MAG: tRNA 2-thiouridine(34) synthase MnmA [Deltaproteobacteria bacterium]|nr:tRNA 2-thiouridine(34) synthase MnmA [Deltaproteobacteria bacterium]
MNKKHDKIAVGMSGGVDSSLAAAILKMDGYDVVGITMKIFGGEDIGADCKGHACYGPGESDDILRAGEVADFLGIPHHVIDLKAEYGEHVLSYFTSEYLAGKTPNPCTRCNPKMKFGFLLDRARSAGICFDLFATGHYVRQCWMDIYGKHVLKKAVDVEKDQSYFLYGLPKEIIPTLLFPLGALTKQAVRARAAELRLPVADRPESQDFIEGGDYGGLFNNKDVRPGDIIDVNGNKMGTHTGIINYTVGQRKGLGIPHSVPLYVLRIDAAENTIVVAPKSYLYAGSLIVGHINLIALDRIDSPMPITAKIRQKHQGAPALFEPLGNDRAKVIFDSPQLAVTPGQSVVFYDNDVVLGGGIIE